MLKVVVVHKIKDYCVSQVDCLFQHAPPIPIWCSAGLHASMGGKQDSNSYWEV